MQTKETGEFTFSPTGEPDQLWILSKASGETYRVDLKDFVCSCADFRFRHAKGDRMCKHLRAASEAYEAEPPKPERLPALAEGRAITISQEEIMQELTAELRDEMIKNYVYSVPDYYRKYRDKAGRERVAKKPGWIDLKASGVQDLAHMIADRYSKIDVGEFRFMEAGDRWIAWRDISLGNFTATGFADCPKDREFPFRYLGTVVMRNAYKAIVPRIYQDLFTNKFREMMRGQLAELVGPDGLGKPIADLTDGELARALQHAREGKGELAPPKPKAEADEITWADTERGAEGPTKVGAAAQAVGKERVEGAVAPAMSLRDPQTIRTIADLYRACYQDFRLQPKDVLKQLGYSSQDDISETPALCYEKIRAVRSR